MSIETILLGLGGIVALIFGGKFIGAKGLLKNVEAKEKDLEIKESQVINKGVLSAEEEKQKQILSSLQSPLDENPEDFWKGKK
jgi:hypothetical protein